MIILDYYLIVYAVLFDILIDTVQTAYHNSFQSFTFKFVIWKSHLESRICYKQINTTHFGQSPSLIYCARYAYHSRRLNFPTF